MARTTKAHFAIFRKAVLRYAAEFGITGWTIEIYHELLTDMAEVRPQMEGRRADVYLSTEWSEEITREKLEEKAKHEAAHILVARVSGLAARRYVTKDELYEAEEELVKLITELTRPVLSRKVRTPRAIVPAAAEQPEKALADISSVSE